MRLLRLLQALTQWGNKLYLYLLVRVGIQVVLWWRVLWRFGRGWGMLLLRYSGNKLFFILSRYRNLWNVRLLYRDSIPSPLYIFSFHVPRIQSVIARRLTWSLTLVEENIECDLFSKKEKNLECLKHYIRSWKLIESCFLDYPRMSSNRFDHLINSAKWRITKTQSFKTFHIFQFLGDFILNFKQCCSCDMAMSVSWLHRFINVFG